MSITVKVGHRTAIVNFAYTVAEAAVEMKIGQTEVKRLIEEGALIATILPPAKGRKHARYRITGWHMIDYLERLKVDSKEVDS